LPGLLFGNLRRLGKLKVCEACREPSDTNPKLGGLADRRRIASFARTRPPVINLARFKSPARRPSLISTASPRVGIRLPRAKRIRHKSFH
jgi:hypothetical protein